ncbi:hypothetical protein [Mahella australiensis]|uniref:Nucleoside recognition domain protein n=1 Tax=Mahella australiensis (strain DSM 15567 / CIP 107919 / 50-1 BON) TaxID=697281 RepID=F4A1G1_MAHA5|nr:hypothetical protein [Mahella australiensis]AEE95995.1 hypothetical protein Mahau_0797 [Mahella australiensis 50-1 BON]
MSNIIFIADIVFAVAATLFINKCMLKLMGSDASIWTGPITEECMKTLPAFLLGLSVLSVHVCFGIVEAMYEVWQSHSRQAAMAGVLAIVTHAAFGVITVWIYRFSGEIILALISAALLHMAWNRAILYFSIGGSA